MSDPLIDTRTPGAVGAASLLGEDWPAQAADTIERVVGSIRSKTTEPIEGIARVVVYGLLAAVLGVAALVILTIGAVRFVDAYLPGEVWSAHLLIGILFSLGGLLLWSKRTAPAEHR